MRSYNGASVLYRTFIPSIQQLLWEKFHQGTGTFQPLCLHFPDLNRSQLLDVLVLDKPAGFSLDFYKTFLQLVLSVFYTKCTDLKELQYLCRVCLYLKLTGDSYGFQRHIRYLMNSWIFESFRLFLHRSISQNILSLSLRVKQQLRTVRNYGATSNRFSGIPCNRFICAR